MNILGTQVTLSLKSFEVYVAGCKGNPHCEGCHNPESWSFNKGDPYTLKMGKEWERKITEFDALIKKIMIFGGEPLDQDKEELISMLRGLKKLGKPIWIFTRYSLDEATAILGRYTKLVDYFKCGRYEKDNPTHIEYGIELASLNQHIYKKGVDFFD